MLGPASRGTATCFAGDTSSYPVLSLLRLMRLFASELRPLTDPRNSSDPNPRRRLPHIPAASGPLPRETPEKRPGNPTQAAHPPVVPNWLAEP
jgi:hypothetical protein